MALSKRSMYCVEEIYLKDSSNQYSVHSAQAPINGKGNAAERLDMEE